MFSAHLRDHTKTTWMIAAFSNLHVSEMRRSKSEAWRVVIRNVRGAARDKVVVAIGDAGDAGVSIAAAGVYNSLDDISKLADLIETDERVDLWQLVTQFSRKPLRHAAAYYQFLIRPLVQAALLMCFQNGLNRFFFG